MRSYCNILNGLYTVFGGIVESGFFAPSCGQAPFKGSDPMDAADADCEKHVTQALWCYQAIENQPEPDPMVKGNYGCVLGGISCPLINI